MKNQILFLLLSSFSLSQAKVDILTRPDVKKLISASGRADVSGVRALLQKEGGKCKGDAAVCLKKFINSQDSSGKSALMASVENPSLEIINLLLDLGADTNIQNKEGNTVLMVAIKNSRGQVNLTINALLSHGANLYKKNKEGLDAIEYANKLYRVPGSILNSETSFLGRFLSSYREPEVKQEPQIALANLGLAKTINGSSTFEK